MNTFYFTSRTTALTSVKPCSRVDKIHRQLLRGLFSLVLILSFPYYALAQNPQPITICSGASIVIKGDAESPAPNSYSWEILQSSVWVGAPGTANTADYTPSALINITMSPVVFSIRRKYVTGSNSAYDSYYDVTALPAAPITSNTITAPLVTIFCSPGNPDAIKGSKPVGGNGTFTFQWQSSTNNVNFTNIAGATSSDYTPSGLTATTYFRRVANGSSCVTASISNTVTITVFAPVTNNVITPPAANSFCGASDPATIAGNTPTGGDGTYVYQWQQSTDNVNFTDISGATGRDYDPAPISVTTYYRRTAISGICWVPVVSNVVTISILSAPLNNVITPPAVTSFCVAGDPDPITGNIPSGGNGAYTYQWQQSTDNVNFTDIFGANAKDYDPPVVSVTTYFRRKVISGPCATPLLSSVVSIDLLTYPSAPAATQPVVTVCPGNAAALSVSSPQAGFTYNWYDSASKTNLLATGTSYTTVPLITNTTFYLESSNGLCSSPVITAVQVNVTSAPAAPLLTTNPVNTCSGTSAALSISSPQAGISYNWYASSTGGSLIFTGTTFTTPVLSANTTYYVEAMNAGGCSSAKTAANVSILPILPALTTNTATAPTVISFCITGDPDVITGNIPSGGNGTYNYQWQQSTDNSNFTNIPGANLKDYDPPVISTTTYYRRTVSSGACTTPIISNVITISILIPPTVPPTVLPLVVVCPGSPANLTVTSPQTGFTYNWYDSPAKTNLLHTGVSYTTPPLTVNKTFYVESTNGLCASSSSATVQVNMTTPPPAPSLVQDTITNCSGSLATFSIANPQTGYTYFWYASATGGTPITSGTSFTTPVLSVNTTYYVDATNAQGCNSSTRTPATGNLIPLPKFTVQGALACPGSPAILTAATTDANVIFNWFTSATGGSSVNTGDTLAILPVINTVAYYVEATNSITGCTSGSRLLVQAQLLQPLSAPVVSVDSITYSSVTFRWKAIIGATSYLVSTDKGLNYVSPSSGPKGLSHTILALNQNQSVSILVKAMGTSGCQESANSAAVTAKILNQTDDIFVPNAFTPNGDGNNDIVYVHSEGIKTLNFYVYNPWGQQIFSSVDKNNGWDGTFKGAKEPFGVYTYYVKAVMNNGHEVNKKGTITLLR